MANRKVYLLTEEQMCSIGTKLSSLSRYVGPENSRTLTLALTELNRAETISSDDPLYSVFAKLSVTLFQYDLDPPAPFTIPNVGKGGDQ